MKNKINFTGSVNTIIYFLFGFILDMLFFLSMAKSLTKTGIILSISSTFLICYLISKNKKLSRTVKTVFKGAFWFNAIISVILLLLYITSATLLQGMLS